jgi:hypothetical protein
VSQAENINAESARRETANFTMTHRAKETALEKGKMRSTAFLNGIFRPCGTALPEMNPEAGILPRSAGTNCCRFEQLPMSRLPPMLTESSPVQRAKRFVEFG